MTYAGIVTRAVALVIDAALVNLIAIITGAAVNLVADLFGVNINFDVGGALVAGFLWLLLVGGYFIIFWDVTGQTPGDRVLGIRVVSANGGNVSFWQAFKRFVGLALCVLTLGIGFLPVLVDKRRRGIHDMLGGTVVQWVDASVGLPPQSLLTPGAVPAPDGPPRPGS